MRWNNIGVQRQIRSGKLGGNISRQPRPIKLDLNNDLTEITPEEKGLFEEEVAASKNSQSYTNPFQRADAFMKSTSSNKLEMVGSQDRPESGYVARKWKVQIDKEALIRIEQGRSAWDKWLKAHNNTSNKKVWEVYDHLAADLAHEALRDIMGSIDKDLDHFCEKVIVDEF